MLGAYAFFYPFARVRTLLFVIVFVTFLDVPAVLILGVWFAGQILSGLQPAAPGMGTGVAWWAHVGGFLVGAGLMPLLTSVVPGPTSQWTQWRARRETLPEQNWG
jgi:membrane associated rhomboid family serine protease